MNQKEIKELIASDEKRLEDVKDGYKLVPEHKQIKEELNVLEKKRAELQNKLYQIEIKYREEHKSDIEFAKEELRYSIDLLRKAQSGLNPNDYNDELIAMFKEFESGTDGKRHKKLQWVSDDGKYALFKRSSFSSYGDRFSKSGNVEAVWALVRVTSDFDPQCLRYFLGNVNEKNKKYVIWAHEGGRWSKHLQKEMEQAIFEYENV